MGHVSAALLACKIGYVGWHTAPWILETTNLQSFPNKVKGLASRLTAWSSARVRSLWVSSKATYALPTFLSLPPPPHLPFYLPVFLLFCIYGHLSVSNCGLWCFCQPARENQPSPCQWPIRNPWAALDNGTKHIFMNKTKGSWFFCPWKTRGVTPLLDYAAVEGPEKAQTSLCWQQSQFLRS